MTDKEKLVQIAELLKQRRQEQQPQPHHYDDEDAEEEAEGFDAKGADTVLQHVMASRRKIKKKHPEKIEQIEQECNHPNQSEELRVTGKTADVLVDDEFLLRDIAEEEVDDLDGDLMVRNKVAPIEVSIVDETKPGGNGIVTARDVRLSSEDIDMADNSSIETLSINSSDSSRDSPLDRRMTRSENFGRSSRTSDMGPRRFSTSHINEKEFNSTAKSSRQEVLKRMQANIRKGRKERKAEMAIIEKQRQKRREIAVKAKEETIQEEIRKGTYSERLEHTLNSLLRKFEEDQNDDIVTLRSAMQLLSTKDDDDQ